VKFDPTDILGMRFNYLLVKEYLGRVGKHHEYLCACDCGVDKVVHRSLLKSGHTTSCGCYFRSICWKNRTTHGHTVRNKEGKFDSPEYQAWASMKDRCTRMSHPSYHNYGGRGITICTEWLNDFPKFLLDMGPRPGRAYSLDRIDNNRGYEIGNVRWATRRQQGNNTRTCLQLEVEGATRTLSEWCRIFGRNRSLVTSRLQMGWPLVKALRQPSERETGQRVRGHLINMEGQNKIKRLVAAGISVSNVAREFRVSRQTVFRVIYNLGAYRHDEA